MLAGLIPALIMPLVFKETLELYYFPLLLISSLIGCIIGTYKNPPTDENSLKDFYKNVKPWGFWKPIKEKVLADDPSFIPNKNFKMDMINILIGIIWQTSLIALPVFIVLRQVPYAVICGFIAISTSVILKLTWWNKLPEK